jgi:endonuclease/exonuclease/phosphatase family metal-dependent hydrolase
LQINLIFDYGSGHFSQDGVFKKTISLIMKRLLKLVVYLVILIALVLGGLILYASLTRFSPPERTLVQHSDRPTIFSDTATVSLLTWNLGYAGLGDDMDFFYDGGTSMRTSLERTRDNHDAIINFLDNYRQTDLLFLQEVDVRAKRSYHINTLDSLHHLLPDHVHMYGQNYLVRFVPVPFYAPMGYVNSGIVSSTPHRPITTERISFPGQYPWPDRLFNLQRCFLKSRFPVDNGRHLVVINTHNSAFDDGTLRQKQMDFLKDILLDEYEKGNYVIAGGDWNQSPPGFEPQFYFNRFDTLDLMYIPENFLPGWQWVYDPTVPTNRRLQAPYHAGETLTTVIDFFLLSPNIEVLEVEGIHLDFEHSDHNPVFARVKLMGERTILPPDHPGR